MFDEITMGALATIGTKGIIENFLDGRIKEIKRDGLSKLEKLIAPDKDYKKRYTKGILDILSNYAKPKHVLIIVSHHKGIPCLLKLKYFGQVDAKEARKEEQKDDPDYCTTIFIRIRNKEVKKPVMPLKKNEQPTLPFEIKELEFIY